MKYTIYKNGLSIMTGAPDLCSEIENHKDAKVPLEMFGLPTECPIPKVSEFCLFYSRNFM